MAKKIIFDYLLNKLRLYDGWDLDIPGNYLLVDAVNGDDSTGEKGSYIKRFATIEGAEAAAISGDYIRIMTDIVEANRGKDGITYLFDKGVQMYYPSTEPNISGQNWNALFTDTSGDNISYTIVGGNFLAGSQWYGNWRRGVVRLNTASHVTMIAAESVSMEENDGWIFHMNGNGSRIDCTCNGDMVFAYEVLRVSNHNVVANIRTEGSMIPIENSGIVIFRANINASNNYQVNISAGKSMATRGHYIGVERRPFNLGGSNASTKKSTLVVNTPIFDYYENYPMNAGDEFALVTGTSVGCNLYVSFNADIVKIHHDESLPVGGYEGGRAAIYSSSVSQYINDVEVDFNVGLFLLGNNHNVDYSRNSRTLDRDKTLVKFNNATIVSFADNADAYTDWRTGSDRDNSILIPTQYTNFVFNGRTTIVINPTGVTAGKKVLGSFDGTNDSAFIVEKVISNGDIKNTSFTDLFTGNVYSGGITNMYLNNNSLLTDFSKYLNLL